MNRNLSLLAATCLLCACLASCSLPASRPPAPFLGLPTAKPPRKLEPRPVVDQYLTGASFVSYDPFDNLGNWNVHDGTASVTDGMLELRGAPGWQGSFWSRQHFAEGQGLVLRFGVRESNARSEFVFVTGDWRTDGFRQFGVYNAVIPKGDLFQGTTDLGGYDLAGSLSLLSNTWYDLLLAIGRNGHFLAVVWNPDNPAQRAVYDLVGGPNWAGRSWIFLPKANEGETVFVDDFFRIAFTDIK